jgi:hypothetical protein
VATVAERARVAGAERAALALVAEAEALEADARHHHRLAARHRREARRRMEQVAAMRRRLAALGITLTTHPGEAPGKERHGRPHAGHPPA